MLLVPLLLRQTYLTINIRNVKIEQNDINEIPENRQSETSETNNGHINIAYVSSGQFDNDVVQTNQLSNLDKSSQKENIGNNKNGQMDENASKQSNSNKRRAWNFKNLRESFLTSEFLLAFLFQLCSIFAIYGFLIYVPAYMEENGLDKLQQSLLLTTTAGVSMLARLIIGLLGNLRWVSPYYLSSSCFVIAGTSTVLCPLLMTRFDTFAIGMMLMVVHGIFGSGITPLFPKMFVNAVGVENSGIAMGVSTVAFGIGSSISPLVFGTVTSNLIKKRHEKQSIYY